MRRGWTRIKTRYARQIISIVGIAHDMRRIKALIADLAGTKAVVEDYAQGLARKAKERTKTLEEFQEAILNVMEDVQESKEDLERKTIALEKAHKELETFSESLEQKVTERTMELSVLYEVSNALSYTLDYQTLLKLIMESLFKIVDYDICASLLFDAKTANITLKPAYAGSDRFVDEVKNNLIDSATILTGENIRGKHMSAFLVPTAPVAKLKKGGDFNEIRSFFNVPFVVRGKTIGMINVSSCRDSAFSEDNVRLIYTIANQTSNSIERLQALITAEESKMKSMVESMIEGVIMVDERDEIVVLNPRARQMLGFAFTDEVTGEALSEKMKVAGLHEPLQEVQQEKRLVTKEIAIPGEENRILRCDITPVQGAAGEIIGIVTILRDITKEKEIDKMKTDFISTVSHELRTPLTTMKEFASIISDEIPGKLTKGQKEYVGIIRSNIDRLARLINDLLDISKIEAGRMVLKKTLVGVIDLVRTTVAALKFEADEKNLEIKVLFSDSAISVYADSDKMTQIFTNLISNAIKFTPDQGKIIVEVKETEEEIACSVTDTGKGIGADDMSKLFTKFQQFGRIAGGGAKGTGLGLAISKELVEAHHGRIWGESKIDKGSKFVFTLPKCTPESLFAEYADTGIKEAAESNSKMSVVMVSLLDFEKLKQGLSVEKIQSILNGMEDALNTGLHRQGDRAFKGSCGIIVILPACDKEGVLKVEGRLEQVLEDHLIVQKLDKKIKLRFGRATYPDDSRSSEELIKKAKRA
ncbi:MAG: PAS domain S-box protein [Candidatus Omnitrophica bacterium]|nr:PAS domain S-box protein [Candidatus Omnitrophota bacterium]